MGIGKVAITGLKKVAQMAGDVIGKKAKYKAMRGVVKTVNAADSAGAALVRGANRAADAAAGVDAAVGRSLNKNVFGPVGKATRDTSASALRAMRGGRTRAPETFGQIQRRKGIVNKKYTPQTQVDEHVKDYGKMEQAKQMFKEQGFGKIWNKPKGPSDGMRGDRMGNNIRWEGPAGGGNKPMPDRITRTRGKDKVMNMWEKPSENADNYMTKGVTEKSYMKKKSSMDILNDEIRKPFDRSKLSTEDIKPSYTSKQVRAGKRVIGGGAAALGGGYAASEYFKSKKASRGQ